MTRSNTNKNVSGAWRNGIAPLSAKGGTSGTAASDDVGLVAGAMSAVTLTSVLKGIIGQPRPPRYDDNDLLRGRAASGVRHAEQPLLLRLVRRRVRLPAARDDGGGVVVGEVAAVALAPRVGARSVLSFVGGARRRVVVVDGRRRSTATSTPRSQSRRPSPSRPDAHIRACTWGTTRYRRSRSGRRWGRPWGRRGTRSSIRPWSGRRWYGGTGCRRDDGGGGAPNEYLLLNESPSCDDDDEGEDCDDTAVEEVELLSSNDLAVLSLQYIAPVNYPPTLVLHWVRGVAIGGTHGSGVRAAPCLRWRGGSIRRDMRHSTRCNRPIVSS
jgi:hypothetical protein